jgi:pimeloyl-ACP methyl ester carboxylesterase
LVIVASVLVFACGAGDDAATSDTRQCPVTVDDADCDTSKRPLVFVHGTLGSADNIDHVALLFASNGYCADRFRAVDYNSLGGDPLAQLDALIDRLIAESGSDQVDLLAHSQGTVHATTYLSAPAHAVKVANYLHLAGAELPANPGGVATLSLSSAADRPVASRVTRNIVFEDLDHYEVAQSTAAFIAMYEYLNADRAPPYDTIQCSRSVTIEGRVLTFPDAVALSGGVVEVYELGDAPRQRSTPIHTFLVADDGAIGPWEATRGQAYELKIIPPAGDPRVPWHYYAMPFKRSDRLLRLWFRSTDPAGRRITDRISFSDQHAALLVHLKRGAFHAGRDSLRIDGFETLNTRNAAPRLTTVGLLLFDDNNGGVDAAGNGISDGGTLPAFAGIPFIEGSDVFMPTSPPAFIEVRFNDQVLHIPNWPSASEGLSQILFD